jgi:DNA-binding transcriptional MerR regulator
MTQPSTPQQPTPITFDTATAAQMLGITRFMVRSLAQEGILVTANEQLASKAKFHRRFTAEAIEVARQKLATRARRRSSSRKQSLKTLQQAIAELSARFSQLEQCVPCGA